MSTEDKQEYVTVKIGTQLFGVGVQEIREVFSPQDITKVPLAPKEIGGLINLRGRIVTAIDARLKLSLPPRKAGDPFMALGMERGTELFGVLVDEVGEVMRLDEDALESIPSHLDQRWRSLLKGVYRLENELLAILDIQSLIAWRSGLAA